MNTAPTRRRAALAAGGMAAVFALSACTAAGAAAPPSDAMMEHSPTPAASMMAESPSPSDAMMEHSPTPAAAIQAPVAAGTLHGVDGSATGTVALYHRPDGTFVVTFEDLSIGTAAHTDVVLVRNADVTSGTRIDRSTLVDLGPLRGTSGMQDFTVPASADAMTYHAVVLWDTVMAHAVAAAPLR
jgi:hypothetical protein